MRAEAGASIFAQSTVRVWINGCRCRHAPKRSASKLRLLSADVATEHHRRWGCSPSGGSLFIASSNAKKQDKLKIQVRQCSAAFRFDLPHSWQPERLPYNLDS